MGAVASDFEEVNFIGVAGLSEAEGRDKFIATFGVDGFEHVVDETGSIWASFGIPTQPAYAFVTSDGDIEVIVASLGEDGLRAKVEELAAS